MLAGQNSRIGDVRGEGPKKIIKEPGEGDHTAHMEEGRGTVSNEALEDWGGEMEERNASRAGAGALANSKPTRAMREPKKKEEVFHRRFAKGDKGRGRRHSASREEQGDRNAQSKEERSRLHKKSKKRKKPPRILRHRRILQCCWYEKVAKGKAA